MELPPAVTSWLQARRLLADLLEEGVSGLQGSKSGGGGRGPRGPPQDGPCLIPRPDSQEERKGRRGSFLFGFPGSLLPCVGSLAEMV